MPDHSGEGRGLLAVEIALEPVSDRLVQHDPRPTRSENDGHLARRRGHRAEIDERLTQSFVDLRLPLPRIEIEIVADPTARAGGAGLHAVAVADDDRHAQPHQRADVCDPAGIRADDLHRLPYAAERGHDLFHPRVTAARIGVYFGEEPRLCPEIDETEWVLLGVEAAVRPGRGRGENPGVTARYSSNGIRRAADRRLRQLRSVRVAGRLAGNGPQPEPLGRVETRTLDPAVIERKALGLAVFEVEFTVIHPGQRLIDERLDPVRVHTRVFEEQRLQIEKAEPSVARRLALKNAFLSNVVNNGEQHRESEHPIVTGEPAPKPTVIGSIKVKTDGIPSEPGETKFEFRRK